MKRILVIVLCILAVASLVCCNRKTPTTVTPQTSEVSVNFVVAESYGVAAPEAVTLQAGQAGGELPLPEGVFASKENYELRWYYDAMATSPYDPDATVDEDLTLYLGESGKSFAIRYEKNENLTYVGDFPTTYTYGDTLVPLPGVVAEGYPDYWYCVETQALVKYVPTLAGCDVTLRSPDPYEYEIDYRSGTVAAEEMDNSANPATINVLDSAIGLQAPTSGGREFVGWVARAKTAKSKMELGGVVYEENSFVTEITYEAAKSGCFAFEAIWK